MAAGGGTGDQIRLTADNSATGGVLDDGHSGVEFRDNAGSTA